jgi:cytochrome c oxidase cbb3-type subunit 1
MITMGSVSRIPRIFGRTKNAQHYPDQHDAFLALATVGTVLYMALHVGQRHHSGLDVALRWEINVDGTLTCFVEAEASHPGYVVRLIDGAFFPDSMLLMAYITSGAPFAQTG